MTLHISHNDLDGIGCTVLTKAAFGSVDVIHTTHNHIDQVVLDNYENYQRVIISDIVPSGKVLSIVCAETECTVVDHHATTEQYVGEVHEVVYDNTVCATKLTYQWLTGLGYDLGKYEYMVELINDYDLWILKHEDSLRMNFLLNVVGINRMFDLLRERPFDGFTDLENGIIQTESERMETYLQGAMDTVQFATDPDGVRFAIMFAERYSSEIGNRVLVENPSCSYVVIINMSRGRASLRSTSEMSILHIAKRNGGGGHPQAAGFPVDVSDIQGAVLQSIGLAAVSPPNGAVKG